MISYLIVTKLSNPRKEFHTSGWVPSGPCTLIRLLRKKLLNFKPPANFLQTWWRFDTSCAMLCLYPENRKVWSRPQGAALWDTRFPADSTLGRICNIQISTCASRRRKISPMGTCQVTDWRAQPGWWYQILGTSGTSGPRSIHVPFSCPLGSISCALEP